MRCAVEMQDNAPQTIFRVMPPTATAAMHSGPGSLVTSRGRYLSVEASALAGTGLQHKLSNDKNSEGVRLAGANDFVGALLAFGEAIELDRDFIFPAMNFASTLIDLGRYEEAINRFNICLESFGEGKGLDSFLSQIYINKGFAHGCLGQFEAAREAYAAAARLVPEAADAYCNMGVVHFNLEEYEQALERYEHALKLNPQHVVASCNKGHALDRLGRYDEAISVFNELIFHTADVDKTTLASAYFGGGAILARLRHNQVAVEYLNEAVQMFGDFVQARLIRGTLLHNIGRNDDALADWNAIIDLQSDFTEAHFCRAMTFMKLSRFTEAIADLTYVLTEEEDRSDAYAARADAYQALGRADEAIDDRRQVVELEPGDFEANYRLGVSLMEAGRFGEALSAFDVALVQQPNDTNLQCHRASMLERLGEAREALAAFGRVLEIDPSHSDAQKGQDRVLKHLKDKDNEYVENQQEIVPDSSVMSGVRPKWMGAKKDPRFGGRRVFPPEFIRFAYSSEIRDGIFRPELLLHDGNKNLYGAMMKWRRRYPAEDYGFAFPFVKKDSTQRIVREQNAPRDQQSIQTYWALKQREHRARRKGPHKPTPS